MEEIVVSALAIRLVLALGAAHTNEALAILFLGIAALITQLGLKTSTFASLVPRCNLINIFNFNLLTFVFVLSILLRPGASSGIFLGSLTWPLVLASRLHLSGTSVFAFWSSTLCSFRLLLLMCHVSKKQSRVSKLEKVFSTMNFISTLFVCLALALLTGSKHLLVVAVLATEVFGSGIIFRKLFKEFPGSATPGEAALLASGTAVYVGDILSQLCFSALGHSVEANVTVNTMLQAAVLGLILMPAIYKTLLLITRQRRGASFLGAVTIIAVVVVPAWLKYVVGLREHLALWLLDFLFEKPYWRLGLCFYWLGVLCVVPYLYNVAKDGLIPQILIRKSYHVLAVIMFVPAILFERQFLHLAFTVAFVLFGLVEMLRIWQIPPFGPKITKFMSAFADHRDTDKLIVSHFSLLLGCALPVWLHLNNTLRPLAPLAGVLSIGIGDTAASYVGYNYGSWKLGRKNRKTVEGTLAGVFSLVLSCVFIERFLPTRCTLTRETTTAAIFAGLVEAYTSQLDNIFVPLLFYSLLCV